MTFNCTDGGRTRGAPLSVVTGAFGYTGRHIAQQLMAKGHRVRTLTRDPSRGNPFGDRLEVVPIDFSRPDELVASLRGASTLYNTYWMRFPRNGITFDDAVADTRTLLRCAREAGVERLVHISVTNPDGGSDLPYFAGKLRVEEVIGDSGLSYAIVRPTLIFAVGDILINNLAWMLRRFPAFALFGDGSFRVQPVSMDDVVEICLDLSARSDDVVLDAAGPDVYTWRELVEEVALAIGRRPLLLSLPAWVSWQLARMVGVLVGDVVVTGDEVKGLMADLLVSHAPALGQGRFREWLTENADDLGRDYASELKRHFGGGGDRQGQRHGCAPAR